jgi:hypothetical protein
MTLHGTECGGNDERHGQGCRHSSQRNPCHVDDRLNLDTLRRHNDDRNGTLFRTPPSFCRDGLRGQVMFVGTC